MSFDWMQSKTPKVESNAKAQVVRELEQRAAVLHRLGYDVAYVTRRCLTNLHWDYAGLGEPPISDTDVERLVVKRFKNG